MAASEIDQSRERLIAGVLRFQREIYPKQKDRYQEVARQGQKPHALFITCADSRIDPEAITQAGPGEIFVSRNIGNLVPSYGEVMGGVSAIIEYAVAALRVSHIVVCGHTDCGAMVGLLHPEKVAAFPTVKSWLRNGEAAVSIVRRRNTAVDEASALEELIEENVLQQLDHLRTHPSVAGSLAEGIVALSGWVYDIAHGEVHIYSEAERKFLPVTAENPVSSGAAARP
jgi:carbonic anhydrase